MQQATGLKTPDPLFCKSGFIPSDSILAVYPD